MLPAKNRLTKRTDFTRIYRQGRFFSEGPLSLKVTTNSLDLTRIGFSIEKKFFKKAVDRNRIKRLLREAFRKLLPIIPTGLDIVVFYKKTENNLSLNRILITAESIIKKIK